TPVRIKKSLPAAVALRTADGPMPVVPEAHAAAFRYGMKCFFEEGRALATLTHPNVVRVLNFFRANETVYLVMRYERGRTLQEHIHPRTRSHAHPPSRRRHPSSAPRPALQP